MWNSFFIDVVFNLMMFVCVLFSYRFFIEAKTNPDRKKFHLFGSLFFLSMWLLVIWIQFWGGLRESGAIILFTQTILISILILDIKRFCWVKFFFKNLFYHLTFKIYPI